MTTTPKLKIMVTTTPTPLTVLEAVRLSGGILREGSNGPSVKVLQKALRRAGHELVVDSDYGAITRTAVTRFQAASRIAADGMVGPITAAYLDAVKEGIAPTAPLRSVLRTIPWLAVMRALTGTKEIPGAKSNPAILSWKAELIGKYPTLRPNLDWYSNDDIPWCGLGAGYAVGCCDPGYMPPLTLLRALAWEPWGQDLNGIPVQGAIAVKARKGGGHVTLVEGVSRDGKLVWCRGANQSDMINVAEYPTRAFIAFRWPTGAILPPMKPNVTTLAALGNVVRNLKET